MKKHFPILTLTLAVVACAIHVVPGAADALDYDRAALGGGEWWRFLSGHLTHFDANHLLWDVGMFLVLGWAAERQSRRSVAAATTLAMFGISAALWFLQPQFQTYRGLSGIDSALFGVFATQLLLRPQIGARLVGAAALLVIGGKFALEFATAATLFARGDGYMPVPLAHVVGLIAGGISGAARSCWPACSAACRTAPSPGR